MESPLRLETADVPAGSHLPCTNPVPEVTNPIVPTLEPWQRHASASRSLNSVTSVDWLYELAFLLAPRVVVCNAFILRKPDLG